MPLVAAPHPYQLEDVTDPSTPPPGPSTWTFKTSPMNIYMGGVLLQSEVQECAANGWDSTTLGGDVGCAAFVNSRAELDAFINECAVQGYYVYLSLNTGFKAASEVDYLLGHTNFNLVRGLEVEDHVSGWTDSEWGYLRDQLVALGKGNLLNAYQTQTQGDTFVNISAITKANPCTVTANAHGLSNGQTVGLSDITGMVELNYTSHVVTNVSTNTFDLTGIDSTNYTTYSSGGRAWQGTWPRASSWYNRSRLWYPMAHTSPEQSYDPDNSSTSTTITGATQANPCVVTATAHGYVDGQTVTIKSVGGMVELNDRQFVVANKTANTFELQKYDSSFALVNENSTGHTAYTTGGTVSTDSLGRCVQISTRFDLQPYPIKLLSDWKLVDTDTRGISCWAQITGQPMERKVWDDTKRSYVQLGVQHMMWQLWWAHLSGVTNFSYYTYRNALFVNRHKDTTSTGSPTDTQVEWDKNTSSGLSAAEADVYQRSWTRAKNAVTQYFKGPGNFPNSNDNAFGYETPYVGVVPFGQSATRRGSA